MPLGVGGEKLTAGSRLWRDTERLESFDLSSGPLQAVDDSDKRAGGRRGRRRRWPRSSCVGSDFASCMPARHFFFKSHSYADDIVLALEAFSGTPSSSRCCAKAQRSINALMTLMKATDHSTYWYFSFKKVKRR